MPILKDFVYGDDGLPIQGALVEAYAPGESVPAATTLSREDGSWELDLAPGVAYRIKYTWGGQSRWLESQVRLQVEALVGLDGVTAPLIDQSVVTTQLKDGAVTTPKIKDQNVTTEKLKDGAVTTNKLGDVQVTTAKLADRAVTEPKLGDGAVSDRAIGERVVNDGQAPTEATKLLGPLLSGLANRIKAITGANSWRDQPVATLAGLHSRVSSLETRLDKEIQFSFSLSGSGSRASTAPTDWIVVAERTIPAGTWTYSVNMTASISPDAGSTKRGEARIVVGSGGSVSSGQLLAGDVWGGKDKAVVHGSGQVTSNGTATVRWEVRILEASGTTTVSISGQVNGSLSKIKF